LVVHSYTKTGFLSNFLDWRCFCASSYFSIAGAAYSLDDILHGVLRGNKPVSGFTDKRFGAGDSRLNNCIGVFDPRIFFVLCYHNQTSPPLYTLVPDQLEQILQRATTDYITEQIDISTTRNEVTLPRIFDWYRDDFGSKMEMLHWVMKFLSAAKQKQLEKLIENGCYVKYSYRFHPAPKPFFRQTK